MNDKTYKSVENTIEPKVQRVLGPEANYQISLTTLNIVIFFTLIFFCFQNFLFF